MKTRLMLILGIAIFLFTNCTKSEIDSPFNTAIAIANMEGDVKSSATDQGYFTWADGDKIGIFTTKGDQLEGRLNSGAGTASGSFQYSYVGNAPELSGYALYPYNAGHIVGEAITFVMPATYELGATLANTNSPMIAVASQRNASASFDFAHLGGLFRFVIKNAPIGTDKFTLSLGGKKINGEFVVNSTSGAAQIETQAGDQTNNITTLTFNALESVQDITLFVPVPVGEYTGIRAKLYAGEEELGSWGSDNAVNNVSRKSLKLMAAITFSNASGDINNEISVGSASQLEDALQNDGVVIMTEPITLADHIEVPQGVNTTIDLQGQSLNSGEFSIVVGEGATLNIINNAPLVRSASDASIVGSGDIITAGKDAVINIAEGVNIESTNNCCIFIPNGAENVTVTTAGNLLTSGGNYSAIYVNGNVKTGTINITGGEIEHRSDVAVYIAGNVNVNISGNTAITGTTAIEQRAGKLTIDGGTFTATAESFTEVVNNNGTTTTGVAVAVCQHNTNHDTKAVIRGGTFNGKKSVYMKPFGENTNVSVEVSGGSFSDLLACEFAVSGAEIKLTEDIEMSEIFVINKDMTLDGGDHSITSNVQSNLENHRAINVTGVNEVTIKNLTIETNGERAINIIGGTKKVILDNVTATSFNYTVNIAGSAPNSNLTITNSELTGKNVVNAAVEGSDIKIENTVLTVVDDSNVEGYGAVHLDKPNSKVEVNGGAINIQGPYPNSSYGFVVMAGNLVSCTNTSGNTDVKGCYAIIEYPGSNYFYSFGSLEEAIAKAESGETVKLIADITIDQTINIEKNVTIDLNGKKLTANAQKARAFKVNADNVNFTLDATGSNVEFGNSTYGIVEIANEVDNAKVTITGGTFVGTTDAGCLIRYRSGNNNEVEINNVNYTDNCPVSGQGNNNAFVIGTNGVGEGNKLTVNGGTYAATGIIADASLSEVLFDGVTVNAKGIGFELKNGVIQNSNITLDPGAYVYSIDGVPILASNSGKIIVSNTTITSPTTKTLSGYGLVVAPTGGEIVATDITINAAEGKKYYIYQMNEGKEGKISVNGEIVAQK